MGGTNRDAKNQNKIKLKVFSNDQEIQLKKRRRKMATLIEQYPGTLFESNIFKPYEPKDFNVNKHISKSLTLKLDDHAKKSCELLKKYGLHNLLGINRTHNHFHLKANEIVEASFIDPSAGICPYESATDFALRLRVRKLTQEELGSNEKKPLPYMWAFDKESKKFYGTQFFLPPNELIEQQLIKLSENGANLKRFYKDFVEYIEANDLGDDLGLVLLHMEKYEIDYEKYSVLEKTDEEKREQWMFTAPAEPSDAEAGEIAITAWRYLENFNGIAGCYYVMTCHHKR